MSPHSPPKPRTAAALIIGNELLSGKVHESNLPVLARTLRDLGVLLRRVVMTLDDKAEIAREVRELAGVHDWVFTSGGIGPTHDDVTIEAVAQAFDVPVVMHPTMEAMLRDFYGERLTEGHLRMGLIPEGASLETNAEVSWPTVRFKNVWLMPGIPEVFKMKIPVVREAIGAGTAFVSRAVYTNMDEGDLKAMLDRVVEAYPDVEIGSYPKWRDASYKTKLTFDGRDASRVLSARDAFVALLPAGEPQRFD